MPVQIQLRHDTAANWTSADPTLALGEVGIETDTDFFKFGDGATAWTGLAYAGGGSFTNPMTTAGDIIVADTGGAPLRLAKGSDAQVLTIDSGTHLPVWDNSASGFSNPMTTKGDIIIGDTGGTADRLGAGTSGYVLTSNGAAAFPSWQAGGGGGGGTTTPVLIQTVTAAPSATGVTLGSAPASGHSLILALDSNASGTTGMSSTNTTWTKVMTATSAGGAVYEVWVGVVSGVGGTAITITTVAPFLSLCVTEIADALTPTVGVNLTAFKGAQGDFVLAGATPGNLFVVAVGNDNTTTNTQLIPGVPCAFADNNPAGAGSGHGVSLLLGYAPTGDIWMSIQGAGGSAAGSIIMAELT